jgi:hypothetical protein
VTGFITLASVKAFIGAGVAVSQYSVWLRTGRPGDRGSIPGRGKRCVQTGSVAQPASYPMGTGVLSPGVKRGRDVTLTTHPHLAQWSWTSRSYTSSPPCASIGVLWDCFKEFIFRGQHTKLVAWLERYSNQRSQSLSGSNIAPLSISVTMSIQYKLWLTPGTKRQGVRTTRAVPSEMRLKPISGPGSTLWNTAAPSYTLSLASDASSGKFHPLSQLSSASFSVAMGRSKNENIKVQPNISHENTAVIVDQWWNGTCPWHLTK